MESVINDLLPVLTSGNTGVWVCDTASGKLEFKNDFFNILGLKRQKIEFSTLDELRARLHSDDLQAFEEAFATAKAGKTTNIAYQCCCGTERGERTLLESAFMPLGDNVIACTVNMTAITQMQHWEKQYRTLVNTLFPNFIFVFNENFHYLDVITPDGLRLFHTREQLIGQDARQFYSPEVSELLSSNIRDCIKNNYIKEVEHHIELHGTRYFYQMRIVPVEGDRAFCLVKDIGDRVRRMEELMTQRKRAEESDKMKSALIANMSHEIRTPLNAIVGFSEFLMNELMPDKKYKYMDLIRNNNSALLQIVNDILDLSRLEAGMCEFNFEEINVVSLILEVIEYHALNMDSGLIKLKSDYPDCDVHVFTDANRVKQVINNLIFNAIKFTEKGSITLKVEESPEYLTFSVADTGCGISEKKMEMIFERFEKLNRFTQGTGLGLPICKAIVEQLGGKISVKSKVNEGSEFSFTIPYRHSEQQKKGIVGDSREIFTSNRKKILVFETLTEDLKYISDILSKKYDLVEISDIEKIVSAFILDQPNLVLMNMEAVSKKYAVAKIHAITPSIPVIAITTSDFYHDQRLAIEFGCADVIAKPFSPSRLEEVIMAFIV